MPLLVTKIAETGSASIASVCARAGSAAAAKRQAAMMVLVSCMALSIVGFSC